MPNSSSENGLRLSADQRRAAQVVLAMYFRPDIWLERRTDVTVVEDTSDLKWATTLWVHVDFGGLKRAGVQDPPADGIDGIVLPLMMQRRGLVTGLRIRDHRGDYVPGLSWRETRAMVQWMVVHMGKAIVATDPNLGQTLDPTLATALRRFGGDIDEVKAGFDQLIHWHNPTQAEMESHGLRVRQAQALINDAALRLFLAEHIPAFIVMARPLLRRDGRCELFIEHHAKLSTEDDEWTLRLPVSVSPSYQCELRLPSGVCFRDNPVVESQYEGEDPEPIPQGSLRLRPVPKARMKAIEPWYEVVNCSMMAGYVQGARRGTEWRLRLRSSIRNAQGPGSLVNTVRILAWAVASGFVAGLVARSLDIHPLPAVGATLLTVLPGAFAGNVLRTSPIPTRDLVAREPRRWLAAIAFASFLGAGALAVEFAGLWPKRTVPMLGQFGWGWTAAAWAVLTVITVVLAAIVEIRSRRVW